MSAETVSLGDPAESYNEHALIRRIRDGEHEAFYELIQPYERRVYATTFAILRNEADADDAAHEAILKAFKNIRQFRAEARFSTWLIQIACYEACMRLCRQRTVELYLFEKKPDDEGSITT